MHSYRLDGGVVCFEIPLLEPEACPSFVTMISFVRYIHFARCLPPSAATLTSSLPSFSCCHVCGLCRLPPVCHSLTIVTPSNLSSLSTFSWLFTKTWWRRSNGFQGFSLLWLPPRITVSSLLLLTHSLLRASIHSLVPWNSLSEAWIQKLKSQLSTQSKGKANLRRLDSNLQLYLRKLHAHAKCRS